MFPDGADVEFDLYSSLEPLDWTPKTRLRRADLNSPLPGSRLQGSCKRALQGSRYHEK